MRTDERLKIIYETIAPAVTRSEAAWKEYLQFASGIYKHQFDNALLVYAQKPKATMLATMQIWNKINRYVNKGEKGTAVFEYNNSALSVKYLFDVTQTNGSTVPEIWKLDNDKMKCALAEKLSQSRGIKANNLYDCISEMVDYTVFAAFDKHMINFDNDIKGHFFEDLPQEGLYVELTEVIENSCKFYIASRCGITVPDTEMPTISHFDTVPLVARLGYTVTEISKGILFEIERTIKMINNERKQAPRSVKQTVNPVVEQTSKVVKFIEPEPIQPILKKAPEIPQKAKPEITVKEPQESGSFLLSEVPLSPYARYLKAKSEHPEHIIFSQVGDFYESYGNDTKVLNELLGFTIVNTKKNNETVKMCGFPVSMAYEYSNTLINAGYPVYIIAYEGEFEANYVESVINKNESQKESKQKQVNPAEQLMLTYSEPEVTPTVSVAPEHEIITEEREIKVGDVLQEPAKQQENPKPKNDFPHRNYTVFNELFPQILDKTHSYLRLESEGLEPLSVEWIGGNRISIMHTYVQNGDLMYDPDITFEVDEDEKTIQALTFEQSNMGIYQDIYADGTPNLKQQRDINSFLSTWFKNISEQDYEPIRAVKRENGVDVDVYFKESEPETAIVVYDADEPDINVNGGEIELIDFVEPITKPFLENYRFSEADNLYSGGEKAKFKANIEAIKLLRILEAERRLATPDEQRILANYVGWGGLANAFDEKAKGWEKEYQELRLLLDDEEYQSAMDSTLTAYYTDPKLIRHIYKALENFGFTDGRNRKILDPAMGTGNFYSVLPESLSNAALHGTELDGITGRIAKHLYPSAEIGIQGFETTKFENGSIDVIVGNIPFNDIKVYDKNYEAENFLIHDYFIAKSLDLLKSGGIAALITSKGTMDKVNTSAREYFAERAELIGAVRLPNTAFKEITGTETTTDILFFRKREEAIRFNKYDGSIPDWVYCDYPKNLNHRINDYFIDNPDMILGEMKEISSRFGYDTACVAPDDYDFYAELDIAINKLQSTFTAEPDPEQSLNISVESGETEEDKRIKAPVGTKNCTYVIKDNDIYYCENGYLEKQDIKGKKAERIKGLCEIRTALLEVIEIQKHFYDYKVLERALSELNHIYDNFAAEHGAINTKANTAAFSDDDQSPLLCSIEDYDKENDTYRKAAVFERVTINYYRIPDHADTAKEALEISLNTKMKVDIPYMARLCGKSEDEVIAELSDKIYLNPAKFYGNFYECWETAEEYLSGNIKEKLQYALLKAEDNESFKRNVPALEAVMPSPLLPSEIYFHIGSPWIPLQYYNQFMYETFMNDDYVKIEYSEYTNKYFIRNKSYDDSINISQTYGTERVNAYEIYEDCLNLQFVKVSDPVEYVDKQGEKKIKYVVNAKETMIAREKQAQIQDAFSNWLFKDKERAEALLTLYNDKFNVIRPREYVS